MFEVLCKISCYATFGLHGKGLLVPSNPQAGGQILGCPLLHIHYDCSYPP